jgi:hypothetical protein
MMHLCFLGTTYEAASKDIFQGVKDKNQAWLHREGFAKQPEVKINAAQSIGKSKLENKDKKASAKPEALLNRLNPSEKRQNILQLSVDHVTTPGKKVPSSLSPKTSSSLASDAHEFASEDLDIIRASDVRAPT